MELLSRCPEKFHCPVPLETLVCTAELVYIPVRIIGTLEYYMNFLKSRILVDALPSNDARN